MSELSQLRKTSVRIKKAPVRLISEHCDFNRQHKSIQYKKLVQERRLKIKQKLKSKLSKTTQSNSVNSDFHQTSNLYKAEIGDQSEICGSRIVSPCCIPNLSSIPRTVEEFLNVLIGRSTFQHENNREIARQT